MNKVEERLRKRIEELVNEANYDEILEEPECQKVSMMDSDYYCECGYCMFGNELQEILDGNKTLDEQNRTDEDRTI